MSTASIPIPLSPIVGRAAEVHQVSELFAAARLVTLTGAGGSGKTRLALEVAARAAAAAAERGGAAAWVDLTPLADPALVPEHVAAALEVRPGPGRAAAEALAAALRPAARLLVLDNCEHLVEACAALVESLLGACPSLVVLTTSREPLGLPGEKVWLVPPLSLPAPNGRPTAAALAGSEAIQLFAERARQANPGFRITDDNAGAVAAICRRLDGLPLALELAAARTRVLSAQQIAERLDDAFALLTQGSRTSLPRQKTLRGTLDWSYRLLAAREQVLLRRLSVFAGSFDLAAVEAVCSGGEVAESFALDALAALVDRSLVTVESGDGETRYRLLETVRQYAREHLREAGEEAAYRRRHAEVFTELAEHLAPELFGGNGLPAPMRRLDAEHENFRAAADWAAAGGGDPESGTIGLRLAVAIHWYWFARGLLAEGWRRITTALDQGRGAPALWLARAQTAFGVVAFWCGRAGAAVAGLREAVATLRGEDDPEGLVYALATLGADSIDGDPAAASAALEEAAQRVEALPPSVLTVFVAYWHGRVSLALGERETACESLSCGLELARRLGHRPAVGHILFALAELELDESRPEAARKLLCESLAEHDQIGDLWGLTHDLRLLAWTLAALGEARPAALVAAAARDLAAEIGAAETEAEARASSELTQALRAELGDETLAAAQREGRSLGAAAWRDLAAGSPAARDDAGGAPPAPAVAAEAALPASEGAAGETPSSAAALEVSALGPLAVRRGDGAKGGDWNSARARELLVFLLLHPSGVTKEEIGLALWPEASASQVRNSFHVTLHRLRGALGDPDAVVVEAGRYRLDPGLDVRFDVHLFEQGVSSGLANGRAKPEALAELLAALDLYRGELLAGEPAGEWHLETRDRLEQLFLQGLAAAAAALEATGEPERAAALYRRWIAVDNLAEAAYRGVMRCLEAAGDRAAALQTYRRLAAVLARELAVEPDEETQALHARVQRAAPPRPPR